MEELERSIEAFLAQHDSDDDYIVLDAVRETQTENVPIEYGLSAENCELDVDNKEEAINLPNTDNLLDIKVTKTSLLGREQAKKRLQAFGQVKRLEVVRPKLAVTEEDKSEEKRSRKPKKSILPSEKAKAVIEEIEEIKKIENAYHAALEEQILLSKHERRQRSISRSRSRERHKRKSKRVRRRSRSREGGRKFRKRKVEKLKYPNNWKELKENDLKLEMLPTIFPGEYKDTENKVFDFRKQLLFQAPSYQLQELVAEGANGEPITFPAEYIRFTKNLPTVSYCIRKGVSSDVLTRKDVFNYVPRHYRNVLQLFINESTSQCKLKSPTRTTSRKWYPKESTACTLLESSLGLTFLQNYSDDDEQEKEENCKEEDIDSDGVIANILDDIGTTELYLSKNHVNENIEEENIIENEGLLTVEVLKEHKVRHKKKKSEHSKSKKKKKKSHKNSKGKREKNKSLKVQAVEQLEQENTDSNVKSSKLSSNKHRKRSKSLESNVTKFEDESKNKHFKKHNKHENQLVSTLDEPKSHAPTKTELELNLENKHKLDIAEIKKKEKKMKNNSSNVTNTKYSDSEKKDIDKNLKCKKIKKKHKKDKKLEKNVESNKISDNEDGRTSEELRKIIQEKQKILEEHTERETEECDTKTKVTAMETQKSLFSSEKESTKKAKLKKVCISDTDDHKQFKETHNYEKDKAMDAIDTRSDDEKYSKPSIVEVSDTIINTNEKLSFEGSDKNIVKVQQSRVDDNIYQLDELSVIDTNLNSLSENNDVIGNSKEPASSKAENKGSNNKDDFQRNEKPLGENEGKKADNLEKGMSYDYFEMLEDELEKDVVQINIKSSHSDITKEGVETLYSADSTPIINTVLQKDLQEDLTAKDKNVNLNSLDEIPAVVEKEIGTPNTDEYYSDWESESAENIIKPDEHNRSWESDEEVHNKYINESKSYKNQETYLSPNKNNFVKGRHSSFSLNLSPISKKNTFSKELQSPENFLEMPFNINNVKRSRHNWGEERPGSRNFYDRLPEGRTERGFRLKSDQSFSVISEDSWEKSELLSIKTEELLLEQERLSLIHERRQLEFEKQRFQEIEKRQQNRAFTQEDRQRQSMTKNVHYSRRDYDQFNLSNCIENTLLESSDCKRQTRNDNKMESSFIKNKDELRMQSYKGGSAAKFNIGSTNLKDNLKKQQRVIKANSQLEEKPKSVQSTVKRIKRSSKSPEKLENEYEKFLKMLESEPVKKKALGKVKVNASKVKEKRDSTPNKTKNRSSKKVPRKRQTKKRKRSSSSSSSSTSSSSASDSDSDSSSTSSSSSTSTSSSSSSSSNSKRKTSKKALIRKKKELSRDKSLVSQSASVMKTKGIQVVKTEIVRTVSNKPATRVTSGSAPSHKKTKRNLGLISRVATKLPLPVPSPKVVINPSTIDCLPLPSAENKFPLNVSTDTVNTSTEVVGLSKNILKSSSHGTTVSVGLPSLSVITIKTEKELIETPEKIHTEPKTHATISEKPSSSSTSNHSHIQPINNEKQPIKETERVNRCSPISKIVEEDHPSNMKLPPKRKRENSPVRGSRWSKADSPRRHSPSPSSSDIIRRKDSSLRRNDYSPRRRDYSPRRKEYSPRRYSSDRSPYRERKESIQETLQRLAGIDSVYLRRKSPVSSPVHGFKRSVADSTISDEQLLQYRVEEHLEGPKYYNKSSIKSPSPICQPLDDKINPDIGVSVHLNKSINTPYTENYQYSEENQQYYEQYSDWQYGETNPRTYKNTYLARRINRNVLQAIPLAGSKPKVKQPPPVQQNEVTNTTQQIKQVGNILEIIPTDSIQKPEKPQSSAISSNVSSITKLSIVAHTTVSTTTKLPPPTVLTSNNALTDKELTSLSPKSSIEVSPASSTTSLSSPFKDMNAETLIKEKMERRAEKDKRKLERELKRDEKEKKRVDGGTITNDSPSEETFTEALLLEKENKPLGDIDNISIDNSKFQWPVPKIIFNSSHIPPEKGILLKTSRFGTTQEKVNVSLENAKVVKFADGVCPGEGTSPSGGEELSSPPPAPKKLPKEKRSKKTKVPKAAKTLKKKKVKVKVVRRAEEEDEDDDLPPPPPPPGSPPSHLFPARIKTIINNIHPAVAVSIANPLLQPITSVAPPPVFHPALNVTPLQRPPPVQPPTLQQHHAGIFSSSSTVTPASVGLPQVPITVPPPNYTQHHIGQTNNHRQSPYISHHHH